MIFRVALRGGAAFACAQTGHLTDVPRCGTVRPMSTAETELTENVKLRISPADRRALAQIAKAGDRSVSAEIRRAIRSHIEAAQARAAA